MTAFSIVICTYNPQPEIFQRLLDAVLQFDLFSPEHEVIIVDSNSISALVHHKGIQSFLSKNKNAILVTENTPGLTAARIAGVRHAKHDWIVFFDDDNEPSADYLLQTAALIEKYPEGGCWGPGRMNVEYPGSKNNSWLNQLNPYFQAKYFTGVYLSDDKEWKDYYPPGSGLIVRKTILTEYIHKVASKQFTLSDRNGKSLASGGDVQIVFTGVSMGYKAGIASTLEMNHLIKADKTTMNYMLRLLYGTASSYLLAYNQVFTDTPIPIILNNNTAILKVIYFTLRSSLFKKGIKQFLLDLSSRMGEINARYVCQPGIPKPGLLFLFERLIRY